jgi:disulfide bond formation protein DsbB
MLTALAALAIVTSGLIGGFHAGVDYHWWEGLTTCATSLSVGQGQSALDAIMNAPLVRCDTPAWTMFGISMAGYNFLISTVAGLSALWFVSRMRGAA